MLSLMPGTAFYLPRPGPVEYQFVYVAEGGEVCGRSRNFTFCSPKPLDELETIKEERGEDEEEGDGDEEEMLLVIPKAQLLQVSWTADIPVSKDKANLESYCSRTRGWGPTQSLNRKPGTERGGVKPCFLFC